MKIDKNKAKLLYTWLTNEKAILSKVYTLAFLQGIMYIAIPVGIQCVVTYIMAGSFSASLMLLCTITIIATLFIGYFQIWQMRINETLHQKIFGNLGNQLSRVAIEARLFTKKTIPPITNIFSSASSFRSSPYDRIEALTSNVFTKAVLNSSTE